MGPTDDAVHSRAQLLPEEIAAGRSTDPEAQAQAILDESEARVNEPVEHPDGEWDRRTAEYQSHEHRRSEDIV